MQMKINRAFWLFIVVFVVAVATATATENWMSAATVQVDKKGLVDSVLLPELHRARDNDRLDLVLIGPDGNKRAFELYMRSSGEAQTMSLNAEKETLLDDGRILWEASLPPDYFFDSLSFFVNAANFTGKVDIEASYDGVWQTIATGSLLSPRGAGSGAVVTFAEAAYDRVRCYFSGFDRHFKQTAIFVQSVEATGRKTGSDYESVFLTTKVEQSTTEDGLEARIFLPGSGLRFEEIEVLTSAQFKGDWQTGREKLNLGQREFIPVDGGRVDAFGEEPQKLLISYPRIWNQRVMLLRMRSNEFFGQIEQVRIRVQLPRLLFVADQEGTYTLQTGHEQQVKVAENPVSNNAGTGTALSFAAAVENPDWQAESVLKNYSARGGPFNADGYSWQAPFVIEKAGFYQLVTNAAISLDPHQAALRIVKDEVQIPYFTGGMERREIDIQVVEEYDKAGNRSLYIIKFSDGIRKPSFIRFRAGGIFNRTLKFEKHDFGQLSWQPWRQLNWVNQSEKEAEFVFNLSQFPDDQQELRLIVEHGSNQPLAIKDFKGMYSARDLFFVAGEPGIFWLMGGNAEAKAPKYDLAMIEDALSELDPVKVMPGAVESIASATAGGKTGEFAGFEQGAPFNDAGYSWVATFTVPAPGFYQLSLNLKAALDSNPDGIRLVKNGLQIPYFPGRVGVSELDLQFSSDYKRDENKTYIGVQLPVASKQWKNLELVSSGVFSRKINFEIRKPGKLGWKVAHTDTWVNNKEKSSGFNVFLEQFAEGETEFRLVIEHGDNSPIEVKAVKAHYQSRTLLFKANEAGEFSIFGGNTSAKAAKYDLAMIKDSLLIREPQRLQLGESADYSGASQVGKHIEEAFSDRGWGIYAVLGLVTFLLLLVIVKLFPEENKPTEPPAS